MLSGLFVFTSTSSTIWLCPSFVYLRESPIRKGEVGALVWDECLQDLFDGMNRGLSNLCETDSLITSSSDYGVKYIWLLVLGSSFVHMWAKQI